MSVSRKLVFFLLIMAVELGIMKAWRRTEVAMQQRSLLRTEVYGQRWKWPVCGAVRENCPARAASLGRPGKKAQTGPLSSAPLLLASFTVPLGSAP